MSRIAAALLHRNWLCVLTVQNARLLVWRDLLEGSPARFSRTRGILGEDIYAAVRGFYPADARFDVGRIGDIAMNLIDAGRASCSFHAMSAPIHCAPAAASSFAMAAPMPVAAPVTRTIFLQG